MSKVSEDIEARVREAVEKHGPFGTTVKHGTFGAEYREPCWPEVLGVLMEEFHEFQLEVFKQYRHRESLRSELLDIAAVCYKAIEQMDNG